MSRVVDTFWRMESTIPCGEPYNGLEGLCEDVVDGRIGSQPSQKFW
jgi:hypothetical protein